MQHSCLCFHEENPRKHNLRDKTIVWWILYWVFIVCKQSFSSMIMCKSDYQKQKSWCLDTEFKVRRHRQQERWWKNSWCLHTEFMVRRRTVVETTEKLLVAVHWVCVKKTLRQKKKVGGQTHLTCAIKSIIKIRNTWKPVCKQASGTTDLSPLTDRWS